MPEMGGQRPDSLKILFVVDSKFPGLGGAESQAIKLANELRDRGVVVEYLTPQVLVSQPLFEQFDGFQLRRVGYPHIKYIGSVVMMFNFACHLIKRRAEFDCMHIHVTRLLTATAGAVRPLTKFRIVTKISGYFEFEGGVLDQRKRLHPVNWLMRIAMKNVDYVQTISAETKEKLISAGFRDEQIKYIPNGIDISQPPPPMPDSDTFTIGYCGRLRDVKGVDVLLEAFAKCRADRPKVKMRVLIAGSGETESKLRAIARKHKMEDAVVFLGLIEDTASFYAELDIYVQPSLSEGLPNSVIEAMHASRAVLATDIGGNQDLIEEGVNGHLFPTGDDTRLAELLVHSIDFRVEIIRMGAAGRAAIEQHYGIGQVVDQLMELYRGK